MKNFNFDWNFKKENDSEWKGINLPHDWLITDTKNLYKSDIGLYRKSFIVENKEKIFYLRFDGIYMDSTLYINGQKAGEWKNGYTAFTCNITEYITEGKNEVLVQVNYQSPNSRWYSGAGIYRDCWLIEKNPIHFVPDGIHVVPKKGNDDVWEVIINTEINSEVKDEAVVKVYHTLSKYCPLTKECEPPEYYSPKTKVHFNNIGNWVIENPQLWDINDPQLYLIHSQLIMDGRIVDAEETSFGFRTIEFHPQNGFFLNGRRVELQGVCQHHDLGGLGAAVYKEAIRRQFTILKEMGVNALRTAHNPPATVFMELADEMGFLVMTELTDIWKRAKTTYDYARFFDEWVEKDIASWVRRDRNCPSIIMWSIGNEIYDTHADAEDGIVTAKRLVKCVTENGIDSNLITLCSNYMPWENTQKCADLIKLIGYNYAEYLYHEHHEKYPDWIIYGGETASTVQSRGIYHFPLKKSLLSDDDFQCSALGNSTTSWGAKSSEACIIDHRDAPFTLGQFLWTGFDYIGEPTPYHTKNSYLGQIDTAGFPKDSYYIYKSAWYKKAPFVHIFPYWDWSVGQPIDVRIASNATKVELFLNGNSLGFTTIDHANGKQLVASYIVPYELGCIKAVAYDENGAEIATHERRSFGDAKKLAWKELTYEDCTSIAYPQLYFVEIYALDGKNENRNPVENANNRVIVETYDDTKLLALDNGDSTDYDQYQNNNNRRLFNGKLLAIFESPRKPPIFTVEFDQGDIPIRKIELCANGFEISAKIFPENATYTDLEWRLTDDAGIDSYLGQLEIFNNDKSVRVIPKGDGEVYVRCATKNGGEHVSLISLYPITITGYGKPFLDPYSFISGGLYNKSNLPMTNGNERGVATLRDQDSHVGFADLDFGTFGSDEFTTWLFPLAGNEFPIEIWQGMPQEEGSLFISTVTYNLGSKWNTYQEVTYKLPRRLKGIQTLCFVFKQKVHIKGFLFTKQEKGYSHHNFANADHIYGDSFKINGTSVENIGNNVTIMFNDMLFEKPATEIEISWRSVQDINSIKLLFTNEYGNEISNMLTLQNTQKEWSTVNLQLTTPLHGNGNVSFIFLPGSDIDLEYFKFIA